jgi:threonine synthase
LFATLNAAERADSAPLPHNIEYVPNPRTLATAIKIGAPVSWQKSLRAVLRSNGNVITVSEQEIADAKAIIGRDGIGCEPASATTVAGIRKLVKAGKIPADESVIGVLTGHVLKDPDYVSNYHRGTLSLDVADRGAASRPLQIPGAFRNAPEKIAANKSAILQSLERRR